MSYQPLIYRLTAFLENQPELEAATLFGSYARGDARAKSDLDVAIWVTPGFIPKNFALQLNQAFENDFRRVQAVELRDLIAISAYNSFRIELKYFEHPEQLTRNYLGSEIPLDKDLVLFDKENKLRPFIQTLQTQRQHERLSGKPVEIRQAIDKFLYEFDNASAAHARSDVYKFYFFFNIALNEALKLKYWSLGHSQKSYLPSGLAAWLPNDEYEKVKKLGATLNLENANQQKRALLDFFNEATQNINAVTEDEKAENHQYCEWIFDRDYLWNFRDLATNNPNIRPGKWFRASSLTRYQNEAFFPEFFQKYGIKAVVDLRDFRELAESSYSDETLKILKHVHAPIDPSCQLDNFKQNYHYGTNTEIAYRYFAVCSKVQVALMVRTMLEYPDGGVLIHCVAGKDRTGSLVTLLHLLSGLPLELANHDYLASESDTKLLKLNAFTEQVALQGGVEAYLISCGITEQEVVQLKRILVE